jgi:hypothetical protein
MIGLIQKLLLDLVEEKRGPEAVATVRERAGVPPDRVFRISEPYPDDEWQRLLGAAAEALGLDQEQTLEAYADVFARDALTRFAGWFETSRGAREMLERQVIIHNVFASGLRDPEARRAVADKFRIERQADRIVTHYRSANKLCAMYRALARWMLRHYGEEAVIEERRCMLRGDEECEIHVIWPEPGRRP